MTWNTAGDLSARNFRRRGLAPAVSAGLVCQKVQEELGSLGKVLWLKNGVLAIEAQLQVHLVIKNQEQDLLRVASSEAAIHGLQPVVRIKIQTPTPHM